MKITKLKEKNSKSKTTTKLLREKIPESKH